MTYQRKVIYYSLGALLGVAVLSFLVELLDGGKVDTLSIGLVALGFSVFEAAILLMIAFGIALFGEDDMTEVVPASEDVLDGKDNYERKLTKARRAKAFLTAAGLVLLLGGSLCYGSLGLGGGIDVR
jgi:hypothetical protein